VSVSPPAPEAAQSDVPAAVDRRGLPWLVPVLPLRQELVLRLLALGWTITIAWFWLWWTAPARGEWNSGRILATAALGWLTLLAAYFLFFVCRMTRPNPLLPVPALRTAMVVTKAPSEPWPVVQRTLQAMLAQDYPHPYDVWLADERPDDSTRQWCREHGVQVSSRFGVAEYHRPSWPRRTKCKEGNLAYFYDTVGYDAYDVVSQLDADHVPAPDYLAAVVRPFGDPSVGYVAAPSVCDANASAGWTVRGRLYREAAMHGPVQAGCNDGWAPVCIGSHYAVRTQALREVGGLGPDLAEDYSTTLWLQSGGWDGVFALDAEAHGDGPESLNDMLVQELQWARSLGTILTRWAPGRLRTCSPRARLRMGFALVYYLLQGIVAVTAALLPTVGVVTGMAWGNTSLAGFYVHIWPASVLLTAVLLWLRRCRVLRPVDARVWAYELLLFQLIRWPWTTWGFFQGMWAGRRSDDPEFRVTPKGAQEQRPLSAGLLLPAVVLCAQPALVVALVAPAGTVLGLYLVLLFQGFMACAVALAVLVLHLRGNRVMQPWSGRGHRPRHAPAPKHRGRRVLRLTWEGGGAAALLVGPVAVLSLALLSWRVGTLA
jgi:cellulose synthase (UDP-forming)